MRRDVRVVRGQLAQIECSHTQGLRLPLRAIARAKASNDSTEVQGAQHACQHIYARGHCCCCCCTATFAGLLNNAQQCNNSTRGHHLLCCHTTTVAAACTVPALYLHCTCTVSRLSHCISSASMCAIPPTHANQRRCIVEFL